MSAAKKAGELSGVFIIGAIGYGLCEILCRGRTHWSMLLAGGICFLWFYTAEKKYHVLPLFYRFLYGSILITSVEFVFGCIFNIALGFSVWDYSDLPLNIMGQICLRFTVIWALFCIPLSFLCAKIRSAVYRYF